MASERTIRNAFSLASVPLVVALVSILVLIINTITGANLAA